MEHWRLEPEGRAFETFTGTICFAGWRGRQVVLKIPDPEVDELDGLRVLLHFAGQGAARVLDHHEDAVLLERALPGRPLAELSAAGRDEEATEVLCDTLAALHGRAPPGQDFNSVEDWGGGFERFRRSPDDSLSPELVADAESLFFQLAASQGERLLLHGDLHHYNILHDERRGWLAIDPKGVLGESAYEIGAALRNPLSLPQIFTDAAVIDRRLRIVSERLGFDGKRVLAWSFAQSVLAAIWAREDGTDHTPFLAVARVLRAKL